MTSEMTNMEQGTFGLMEDLAEMLRTEILPTHVPLIQLIDKVCEDPKLKHVDLYSKYTRLAAVVGGDWVTMKEELQNATRFGAPALYCSISSMLAVFTCRRSRSHDELVSSLTDLYNHFSAGNETLNKQVVYAITTIGKQMEHANIAEASISNLNERVNNTISTLEKQVEQANIAEASIASLNERVDSAVTAIDKHMKLVNVNEMSIVNFNDRIDNAINTMEKQMEQANKTESSIVNLNEHVDSDVTAIGNHVEVVNKAEACISNMVERADNSSTGIPSIQPLATSPIVNLEEVINKDNVDVIAVPNTTFRCKYGTLTIDDKSQCSFTGRGLEARILALWLTLPVSLAQKVDIMNRNHELVIKFTRENQSFIEQFCEIDPNYINIRNKKLHFFFYIVDRKSGQWSYIG